MTNTPEIAKLPLIDTVKYSFVNFIQNISLFAKLLTLGLVVVLFEMFSSFPTLCSLSVQQCESSWQNSVSTTLLLLVSISAIIFFCRHLIIKNMTMSWAAFCKAIFYYIAYSFFMLISITIPSLILMYAYGILISGFDGLIILNLLPMLIPLAVSILFSPLFLVFPAITVEDKSFNLSNVFKLAKGNYNNIFWSQFILMLPCALLAYALSKVYQLIGVDNYVLNEVFIIILITLSMADSCLKATFYARIYSFFKQQQKQ